ncbi:MAG: monofunctional biosynthetic peptidoglycan transglycosylase [Saprospiraceae bacterium]|nr:monofunctional biosynthetic peptidoglycan transglycosylase [Saprospiraceae bacterium]
MRRKTKTRSGFRRFFNWALKIFLAFLIIQILTILIFRWVPVPITPLIVIRGYEKLNAGKMIGYHKDWVSWSQISDHPKAAVISSEDQRFLDHHGFDLKAIEKAMKYNEKQEKRGSTKRRGASTISQQTAKNLFLWPGRSWLRKGLEVMYTFLIELLWPKERILEVYLNIIELGDGVYGVEAASQLYFNKPASKLNRDEAALLAAVLPSPRKYSASKPGPYIRRRKEWIKRQMRNQPELYVFAKGR